MEEKQGILELCTAEMQVGNVTLQYIDAKTGEVKAEGVTRPDIILRQLCTRPGQVGLATATSSILDRFIVRYCIFFLIFPPFPLF